MTRILVIEDQTDLAFGLCNNLEVEGYSALAAHDGREGLALARTSSPDLLILDLMLPELDGFLVLGTLRREGFAAPILVLTARGEEADVVRALRLGADDYVTKPFGLLELLARVDALLRRRARAPGRSDRELRFGDVVVDVAARSVQRGGETVPLTPKELDLLLALARRDGAVASRVELIREVWGYPSSVITRTVDTHVAELRRKLEPEPRSPRYILTVSRVGYRFAGG